MEAGGHIRLKMAAATQIRAAIFCKILVLHVVRLHLLGLHSFPWSLLLVETNFPFPSAGRKKITGEKTY